MINFNPIVKTTFRLLTRHSTVNFCINAGYLNPAKHITMNHNPHNVYIDQYDIGQYPEVI